MESASRAWQSSAIDYLRVSVHPCCKMGAPRSCRSDGMPCLKAVPSNLSCIFCPWARAVVSVTLQISTVVSSFWPVRAANESGPYLVYWWDTSSESVRRLADITKAARASEDRKPEAILALDQGAYGLRFWFCRMAQRRVLRTLLSFHHRNHPRLRRRAKAWLFNASVSLQRASYATRMSAPHYEQQNRR